MPNTVDFTLEELVRIAFEPNESAAINTEALRILINAILKKLCCSKEKIGLSGKEAKCIDNLLKEAKSNKNHVIANDEKVSTITEPLEKIDLVEGRIESLVNLLEKHLDAYEEQYLNVGKVFDINNTEEYKNCKPIITECDPEHEAACSILQNLDFLEKVQRYVSAPFLKRFFKFEKSIVQIKNDFEVFMEGACEYVKMFDELYQLIKEMDGLRKTMEENKLKFVGTMEEIQDMMDTKTDKVKIIHIRNYFLERFKAIEKILTDSEYYEKQQSIRYITSDEDHIQCLLCGYKKVYIDTTKELLHITNWPEKKLKPPLPKNLKCPVIPQTPDLTTHMVYLKCDVDVMAGKKICVNRKP